MRCAEPGEIEGFVRYVHEVDGRGYTVYHRGPATRPGVILLHELPGMVEQCVALGRTLSTPVDDAPGYEVHMPLFFGAPGQRGGLADQARWLWCMRHEMNLLSLGEASPITAWVAGLVDEVARRTGVGRVAVIGMCLTGSLVFGLVAEPLAAVVASQPALPFGISPWHRRAMGAPRDRVEEMAANGTQVLAMRYRGDPLCPRARLEEVADTLGHQLPPASPGVIQDAQLGSLRVIDVPGRKHSLLTLDLNSAALGAVQEFLQENLG